MGADSSIGSSSKMDLGSPVMEPDTEYDAAVVKAPEIPKGGEI
jgi:hypothetical protein